MTVDIVRHADILAVVHGFFPREACNAVVGIVENAGLFEDSVVLDGYEAARSGSGRRDATLRTSSSATLKEGRWPQIDALYRAARELIGCQDALVEAIQVTRYAPGAFFGLHFDAGHGMARHSTILLYLNEGFEGGLTVFPELDIAVVPRAGDAVYFNNMGACGEVIGSSAHSSTPITAGVKMVANIWLHQPSSLPY